jgi:hypothetical protein
MKYILESLVKTNKPYNCRSLFSKRVRSSPASIVVRASESVVIPSAIAISRIVRGRRAATIISKIFLTVSILSSRTRQRIFSYAISTEGSISLIKVFAGRRLRYYQSLDIARDKSGVLSEVAAVRLDSGAPVVVALLRLTLLLEFSLLDQSPHELGHFLPLP